MATPRHHENGEVLGVLHHCSKFPGSHGEVLVRVDEVVTVKGCVCVFSGKREGESTKSYKEKHKERREGGNRERERKREYGKGGQNQGVGPFGSPNKNQNYYFLNKKRGGV